MVEAFSAQRNDKALRTLAVELLRQTEDGARREFVGKDARGTLRSNRLTAELSALTVHCRVEKQDCLRLAGGECKLGSQLVLGDDFYILRHTLA